MKAALWLAASVRALVRGLVLLGLACGTMAIVLAFGLAWRLAQGPLDLGWALPRIEAALNRPGTPAVAVAGATLAWTGYTAGPGQDVAVHLVGLRMAGAGGGTSVLRVASLDVGLAAAGLLSLRALLHTIEASGIDVRLLRAADGAVMLDLPMTGDQPPDQSPDQPPDQPPDLGQAVRDLARPPRPEGAGPIRSRLQELQTLDRVRLTDVALTLRDPSMGDDWHLDVAALDLVRQPEGGVVGQATAALGLDAVRAGLSLRAALTPDGGTRLDLVLAPLPTAAVQRAAEAQGADLGAATSLETAVQGGASLLLDAGLQPRAGSVRVSAGAGRLRVGGTEIGFDSLALDAEAAWPVPGWTRPGTGTLSRLKAVLHTPGGPPSTVQASGEVVRDGERLAGRLAATLDHLTFTDLVRLWPERWGGHVRPWLARSITAGTARDGRASLSFTASSGLTDAVLTGLDASVAGDDTTIAWLRPVPPVEHAQALLSIRSAGGPPDALDIAITAARQGSLAISNGTIHVSGLDVQDQFLTMNGDTAGSVAEVIQLLRHPRLQLLSRKPIPMRNPGGSFTGHLSVFLPLNEDLDFDDVKIGARGHATELRLGGLVAGRDLDHGDILIDASSEFLKAQGRATLSGLPSDLLVEMDFRGGAPAQVATRAQATTRAGVAQLAAAGLDTGGIMEAGQGVFTARYAQRRDGTAELALSANLRDAALGLAGWTKPAGQPAEASGRLLLRGDQMLGIDGIKADGPGLALEGRAEMVGDRPLLLRLDRVTLGATQGSGELRFPARPGDPIRSRLEGTVLDLSALLARKPGRSGGGDTAWVVDVRFDRVLLAASRFLSGVTAHAEQSGGRLVALRAVSAGPEMLDATIERVNGVRTLNARAADGGGVLRAMDLVDSVQGGAMTLKGAYDDRGADRGAEPKLRGTVELEGFRVRNAPGLGKLLQAVTVYGLFEALSGPGLSFSRLSMPFQWDGTVLEVSDVEAFSASLGLTARGRVDAARKTIDLQGTVVPLYVINSLLGRIPLVGRLFSAEKGGGLLAINYSLRGPVADPTVSANPLSALTPGFLRGLFRLVN